MTTAHVADSRLVVMPSPDNPGALLVDAEALMRSPHQVRYWLLQPDESNNWWHAGSGQRGPLVEVLGAITHVYVCPCKDIADAIAQEATS